MVQTSKIIFFSIFFFLAANAQVPKTVAPAGAEVYFINLKDGASVKSPVTIQFGLKKMGVAPAGTPKDNTGHHHLIIDNETPSLDLPIPADAQHVHFGAGQTETSVELTPGKHTLQLVFADLNHVPHNPPVVSKKITITVKK